MNRHALERIVAAVDPQSNDTILEVGAGFGVLTTALVASGARMIAIERDRRMLPILREQVALLGGGVLPLPCRGSQRGCAAQRRVEIVEGDVLALLRAGSPFPTLRAPWKVAANLPYAITSDFFRMFFDRIADGSLSPPERAVFLLQREVVDRLTAVPGKRSDARTTSVLTILAQLHATPRRIVRVPATHFWPPPKVESAVIAFDRFRGPRGIADFLMGVPRDAFLHFVHGVFAERRKQIRRILTDLHPSNLTLVERALRESGVRPAARPEELTMGEWVTLARNVFVGTGLRSMGKGT